MNIYLYEYKENILVYIEGGFTPFRSGLAQRKRVGPITQRSEDRNLYPLITPFPVYTVSHFNSSRV